MGILLTANSNTSEFNDYLKNQNKLKHQVYKNLLEKQINERINSDNNKIINGQAYRVDNPILMKKSVLASSIHLT